MHLRFLFTITHVGSKKALVDICICKSEQRLDKTYSLFSNRLIHDRELTLHDGTRLLREDRYQNLKEELQISEEKLQER